MRGFEAGGADGARPSAGGGGRRRGSVLGREGRVAAVANLEPDALRAREVLVENARRRGVAPDLLLAVAAAGAAVVVDLRQRVMPFGDGAHRLSSRCNKDRKLIMGTFSFSARNARVR